MAVCFLWVGDLPLGFRAPIDPKERYNQRNGDPRQESISPSLLNQAYPRRTTCWLVSSRPTSTPGITGLTFLRIASPRVGKVPPCRLPTRGVSLHGGTIPTRVVTGYTCSFNNK